ncbi:hypothetical protein BJ944DRAFT_184461, partial [Cunninghamella echinulata]
STVYEVTLDNNGVARQVGEGQGTHFIHISEHNETILEEKPGITITQSISTPNPTFQKPLKHSKRIHPLVSKPINEKNPASNLTPSSIDNITTNKV